MATKTARRTSSGRGKAAGKRRKKKAAVRNEGLWDEILLLFVMAVSVLLFLSNFGLIGAFGNTLSGFLFGIFGWWAYVAPMLLFISTAFAISNLGNPIAALKVTAMWVLFLVLCILLTLFAGGIGEKLDMAAFYEQGQAHVGGGALGGALAFALCASIGEVGAYVVCLILGIICAVLITERSFLGGVKKGGQKLYSTAREDADRRRRQRLERLEAQEEAAGTETESAGRPRRRRKVSGVILDTTLAKETPGQDEIHEITIHIPEEETAIADMEAASALQEPVVLKPAPIRIRTEQMDAVSEETAAEPLPAGADVFTARTGEIKEPAAGRDATAVEPVRERISSPAVSQPDAKQARAAGTDAEKEEAGGIEEPVAEIGSKYKFPPVSLLHRGSRKATAEKAGQLTETAKKLEQTLASFGVRVTVTEISQGPTVTRYEMQPEQGVKVSKIVNLADDIKLNLAATDIRIEAPIPGKAAVGIEVPNKEVSAVMFRDLIESKDFKEHSSNLAFASGKDIAGKVVVADIARMPHVLIAGATGSGKSVCINTIIMSILYKAHPDDVKMIMVDPKVVELSVYNGIPHLMIPVVTDPKKAAAALHWGVVEMDERYKKFAEYNVRDLKGYNKKIEGIEDIEDENKPRKMPQIVIIVDELADLMIVAPGEVEESICRLAQLARAAGIHLIIATQRPSVDVITGLIKANMPSRIAFAVSSGVDSRTILDMVGAEKLLGKGDMLFYPQGYPKPARVQGAFVSDEEVSAVVEFLAKQDSVMSYNAEIEEKITTAAITSTVSGGSELDEHFMEAGRFIIEKDKASIGMLQRVFKVGFNRAARIMDQLSDAGVVGPEEGTKPRKVLMSMEQFEAYIEEQY